MGSTPKGATVISRGFQGRLVRLQAGGVTPLTHRLPVFNWGIALVEREPHRHTERLCCRPPSTLPVCRMGLRTWPSLGSARVIITPRAIVCSERMLLAHMSDTHIALAPTDDNAASRRCLEAVSRLQAFAPQPDCVVVTGDVADHGTSAEYELASELLTALQTPVHLGPGNHDDTR